MAFEIGLAEGTSQLVKAVLEALKGQDAKLDELIAGVNAMAVSKAGVDQWFSALPAFLEGQQRIEALSSVKDVLIPLPRGHGYLHISTLPITQDRRAAWRADSLPA